ncbi:beta-1,6-N-acetylglucosaminyltransferase [Lachnospiraceae bacterium C1.1]|nr:beta-1,6-N-acetylglucosaminyltransferase [Lachnospiraceae bacterium C1.1]
MQALIITAYKNYYFLKRNCELFSKYFKVYVHIDKRSSIATEDNIRELNSLQNVYAISKYKIYWGSYLHMMAVADLMEHCVRDGDIHRIHIISGEDFPIKRASEFETFFSEDNTNNYIELADITNMPVMQLRYQKYHFQFLFDRKSRNKVIVGLDKVLRQIQYHIPLKRKISFDYKGLIWSSITLNAAKTILNWLTPERIKELKFCEIAEEFLIQNPLMESECMRKTVITDSLRFDNWKSQLTGPKALEISDKEQMDKSGAFFARKFECNSREQVELYESYFERFEIA